MKTVILGAQGQLGCDLQQTLQEWDLYPFSHQDLDICDRRRVEKEFSRIDPDLVINAAAYTAVDECETEVEKAFNINAFAARHLAIICSRLDCKLVHFSTNYVFDGRKETPYTEDDLPNPLNVYGASKLTGEYFTGNICPDHLIIRTSGLFAAASLESKRDNFVETMIQHASGGKTLQVVDDQVLSPTYGKDLARAVKELVLGNAQGLYHITNQEHCSWFEFAKEIFRQIEINPPMVRITTEEHGADAPRPAYSILSTQKFLSKTGWSLPSWQSGLTSYLEERGP